MKKVKDSIVKLTIFRTLHIKKCPHLVDKVNKMTGFPEIRSLRRAESERS